MFKIIHFFVISIFFYYFSGHCIFADQKYIINDIDLKTIENGDCNSASRVLYKMRRIYDKEGKDPIIPAIPALIKRANADLKMDLDEGEGESIKSAAFNLDR